MTNTTMSRLRRQLKGALLPLAVSCLVAAARAEESSPAPNPEPAPESAKQAPADETRSRQPASRPGNAAEDFIPTEEISEDFAVSFPVDI